MKPLFNTITADDWRRAIARGRREGNLVLEQIRAKVLEKFPARNSSTEGGKTTPAGCVRSWISAGKSGTAAQRGKLNQRAAQTGSVITRRGDAASPAANFTHMENKNIITEAQAIAFLSEQARLLSAQCEGEYCRVGISVRAFKDSPLEIECTAYVHEGASLSRATLTEATEAARAAYSPSNRALALRAKAAELLADAAKLEGAA